MRTSRNALPHSCQPLSKQPGLGLIDTLVGLALLAVALLGASAALIQAMRATHSTVLQSRAVDLAADLSEDLRAATGAAAVRPLVDAWRLRVTNTLPVSGLPTDSVATALRPSNEGEAPVTHFELLLQWHGVFGTRANQLHIPAVAPDP